MATPENSAEAPPRKGLGCLGWLAICAAVLALLLLLAGILIWQFVSWVKNAPEPTVATYAPLKLSPGEEEDVGRVLAALQSAKEARKVVDETVTPAVFNGVIERVLENEKRQGRAKPEAPLFFRGGITETGFHLMLSVPAQDFESRALVPGQYVNADVSFDLEIVDGVITRADVQQLKLRGREPPALGRWVIRWVINKVKAASRDPAADNKLHAFKLFKREGDRLHFILDGAELDDGPTAEDKHGAQKN